VGASGATAMSEYYESGNAEEDAFDAEGVPLAIMAQRRTERSAGSRAVVDQTF